MTETTAEKTARLRALRYVRDGSPDERKARAKAYAEAKKAARTAAAMAFFDSLHDAIKAGDDYRADSILAKVGIYLPPRKR